LRRRCDAQVAGYQIEEEFRILIEKAAAIEDREKLRRLHSDVQLPAISTAHAVLDRHGLVTHRRRRRGYKVQGTTLSRPGEPNDLWCAEG
jgi:hypothetical protein